MLLVVVALFSITMSRSHDCCIHALGCLLGFVISLTAILVCSNVKNGTVHKIIYVFGIMLAISFVVLLCFYYFYVSDALLVTEIISRDEKWRLRNKIAELEAMQQSTRPAVQVVVMPDTLAVAVEDYTRDGHD
jgi:hypothetical protein